MPDIEANRLKWGNLYSWKHGGDNWSAPWGSVDMQWHASILPRIHRYVPAGTILEIAPGYGRWTHYLKDLCRRLIVVDLAPRCIAACQERFAGCSNIEYHVNDGVSLAMVPDGSVDFAFSFDSMVHAEEDVIQGYLEQLATKLAPQGVGFIHHSNLGEYARYFDALDRLPPLRLLLRAVGLETKAHARGRTVSGVKFAGLAARVGLRCLCQELINWRSNLLIDCLTVFVRQASSWPAQHALLRNHRFMTEAKGIANLARLYGRHGSAA